MLYDILHMWNLKEMIQMNLQNRNKLTNLVKVLSLPGGQVGGRDS